MQISLKISKNHKSKHKFALKLLRKISESPTCKFTQNKSAKGRRFLTNPVLMHEALGTAIPSLTAAVDFACSVSGLGRCSTT